MILFSSGAVEMTVSFRKRLFWFLFFPSGLHLVGPLRGDEEVVQGVLQVLEGGPLLGLLLPAGHHQLVQLRGAALRTRHAVEVIQLPDHLWVGHPWRRGGESALYDQQQKHLVTHSKVIYFCH